MFLFITEYNCDFYFLFYFNVQEKKTRKTTNNSKHKPEMNQS